MRRFYLFLFTICLFSAWAAAQAPAPATRSGAVSFNPDLSAIVDMYYHADDSDEGISHLGEEMSGFGHSHGGEEHHHHGGSGKDLLQQADRVVLVVGALNPEHDPRHEQHQVKPPGHGVG
jgi:hypothetical protein